MTVRCVVQGCNNTGENSDVSFFKFPKYKKSWKTDRMKLNSEWVTKIKNNRFDKTAKSANYLWQPDASSYVCSDHFTKECFTRDPELAKASGFKQLRLRDAEHVIPTLMLRLDENNKLIHEEAPKARSAFLKRQRQSMIKEILENYDLQTAKDEEDTSTTHLTENEPAVSDTGDQYIPLPTSVVNDMPSTHNQGMPSKSTRNQGIPSKSTRNQGIQAGYVKKYVKRTQTEKRTCTNGTQTTLNLSPPKVRFVSPKTFHKDVSTTTDALEIHCVCCSKCTLREAEGGNKEETENILDDWHPELDSVSEDESDDSSFESCPDEIDTTDISERKFIISESCLKELLSYCRACSGKCSVVIKRQTGTIVAMESRCQAVDSHKWTIN